ncbi:hypothetical protein J6590_050001 [Homalodisca vitripennis]|nr:hypothetical protein J6590_050001 [Homalodisca vitripennis]
MSAIVCCRKRSSLLIPRVRVEDAGRYECRAISVRGESMATYAVVTVHPVKPSQGTDNMFCIQKVPYTISNTTRSWYSSSVTPPLFCRRRWHCKTVARFARLLSDNRMSGN